MKKSKVFFGNRRFLFDKSLKLVYYYIMKEYANAYATREKAEKLFFRVSVAALPTIKGVNSAS